MKKVTNYILSLLLISVSLTSFFSCENESIKKDQPEQKYKIESYDEFQETPAGHHYIDLTDYGFGTIMKNDDKTDGPGPDGPGPGPNVDCPPGLEECDTKQPRALALLKQFANEVCAPVRSHIDCCDNGAHLAMTLIAYPTNPPCLNVPTDK